MAAGVESVWKAIFDHSPDGMFLIDEKGLFRAFNPAMENLTGWKQTDVLGKEESFIPFHCTDENGAVASSSSCSTQLASLKRGLSPYHEHFLKTKWGRNIVVIVSYKIIPFHVIGKAYFLGIMKDITERKAEENMLKVEAVTDSLTGLYNFRYFQRQLDLEIKRANRYLHPLSLIIADIDHFKDYNDRYGHPQGNVILKRVAELLKLHTRETNAIARYGGDEFVILLPEADIWIALRAAARIRKIIQKEAFLFPGDRAKKILTVSLGVASLSSEAMDAEGLVRSADAALYRAKASGRNQLNGSVSPA
jgi:diguanylate cyclase (GGDEF)-like protein/PAS domain S-box-containing protein